MAGETTYTATEADSIGAHRDWWRGAVFRRKTAIRYLLIGTIAFAVGAVGLAWDEPDYRIRLLVGAGYALVMLIVLGSCLALGYILLPRRVRRLYRQTPTSGQEWTFTWSDQALSHSASNGSGRFAWSDYHHWRMGRDAFQFYLNDNFSISFRGGF